MTVANFFGDLPDDRCKDEKEDRDGQSSAKKNQLALADSFDSLDVSSGRKLRSGLLVVVEILCRLMFNDRPCGIHH